MHNIKYLKSLTISSILNDEMFLFHFHVFTRTVLINTQNMTENMTLNIIVFIHPYLRKGVTFFNMNMKKAVGVAKMSDVLSKPIHIHEYAKDSKTFFTLSVYSLLYYYHECHKMKRHKDPIVTRHF